MEYSLLTEVEQALQKKYRQAEPKPWRYAYDRSQPAIGGIRRQPASTVEGSARRGNKRQNFDELLHGKLIGGKRGIGGADGFAAY